MLLRSSVTMSTSRSILHRQRLRCTAELPPARPLSRWAFKPWGHSQETEPKQGPFLRITYDDDEEEDSSSEEDAQGGRMKSTRNTATCSRVVFTHERWARHMSADRYLQNIRTIPYSRILRTLIGPVVWVMFVATMICCYDAMFFLRDLPAWLPRPLNLNSQPHILTSFALSLLLVFRTNSAYSRWDEAFRMLGGVVTHSRSLVLQACSHFSSEKLKRTLARWVLAFSVTLQAQMQGDVQGDEQLEDRLACLLSPEEAALVLSADNKVLQVIQVISEIMKKEKMEVVQQDTAQKSISYLTDVLSGCERIFYTPIPVSYTRHTCRFMLIWLTSIPFGIYNAFYWATIPVTGIMAFLLLGIDEIGQQIEEPFGIIDFDSICGRLESDLWQIIHSDKRTKSWAETCLKNKGPSQFSVDEADRYASSSM